MNKLIEALNPAQREAVEYLDGPELVLAGAGSGKTRVLTYKIAYVLAKKLAQPYEILAVTFTNKAANEMKRRVESLINSQIEGMWIGTFHSICARILRIEAHRIGYHRNFTIYDTDDQRQQIQRIIQSLNLDKNLFKARAIQYEISRLKNKMISPEDFDKRATDYFSKKLASIYWEYEVSLRRNNAFDFDDLLLKPLEIFTRFEEVRAKYQNKFKFIFVDEYQDTNKPQYHLIKILSAGHRRLCVVGDEDQSIYKFRGADIENILNFEKDFPNCRIIRLEQNYRSTQTILDAANSVVAHNFNRLGKNLWSDRGRGEKIQILATDNETAEARKVVRIIQQETNKHHRSLNEIVILYRTNAQSRALETQLRQANIPYQIIGGIKFYERKEIKDILAYLKVLVNEQDSISLTRIINVPPRGIGAVTLKHLGNYAASREIPLYKALLEIDRVEGLTSGARRNIRQFVSEIESLKKFLPTENALEIARRVIDQFHLRQKYLNSTDPEDQARLENVNELINSIDIFVNTHPQSERSLEKYLEEISLITDIDTWDPNMPVVTLMTLHSAKGLEFPVVIITGLEEGLFPIFRSIENPDELEEERRLFYVGMTRAKERLYLLWANSRHRFTQAEYGSSFRNIPSRFLKEIPDQFKEEFHPQAERLYREKKHREAQQPNFLSEMTDESGEYRVGQWIQHEAFGKGQIVGIEQSNLGTKLTIAFGKTSIKKIIAEYANLEIL